MTIRERCRSLLASVGSLVGRGTRRGAHEAQVRRLQWQIERHKAALGKAVYPLLETGALEADLPEVDEALARIRELYVRLRQLEERQGGGTQPGAPPSSDESPPQS